MHTKQLIKLNQHKTFCYKYKNGKSLKWANIQYAMIQYNWLIFGIFELNRGGGSWLM
jgi:hypothetical protein